MLSSSGRARAAQRLLEERHSGTEERRRERAAILVCQRKMRVPRFVVPRVPADAHAAQAQRQSARRVAAATTRQYVMSYRVSSSQ